MALTFRINLVGPSRSLIEILTEAEEPLADMGFRRDRSVIRADPAPANDDLGDEEVELRSLIQDAARIADWKGVAAEWTKPSIRLSAQIVCYPKGFLNAYVGIDRPSLGQLYATDKIDVLHAALVVLATACGAVGGFGMTSLPFEPVAPDVFEQRFFREPISVVAPYPIALFAKVSHPREQIDRLAPAEYTIHEFPGYWLLEERGFVEIVRRFA